MAEMEALEAAQAAVNNGVSPKTAAIVALVMLALGGGTGTLLSGVSQDKHDALAAQVVTHDSRIERLEDRERDLFIAITQVQAATSQVRQDQAAMKHQLDRIETRLEARER